jgi:hypothetical protein
LMITTGNTEPVRRAFLQEAMQLASVVATSPDRWTATDEQEALF